MGLWHRFILIELVERSLSGIQALLSEECDLAIVGAITTHFFTAPFGWAASVNVASKKGQCAAFSREADGYVPSVSQIYRGYR